LKFGVLKGTEFSEGKATSPENFGVFRLETVYSSLLGHFVCIMRPTAEGEACKLSKLAGYSSPAPATPAKGRQLYPLYAGQLSLAILSWVGAMSTSQRAVMSCG